MSRYPGPDPAEGKSFWDQIPSSVVWGDVGLILLSSPYSYCFQRSCIWPSPEADLGGPSPACSLVPYKNTLLPKLSSVVGWEKTQTHVCRRALQSPGSSRWWHREVRLEEGLILEGGEQEEAEIDFKREQVCRCWGEMFEARASGMRQSVDVTLVAKALYKYNRDPAHHFNALAPCHGNSLCAHRHIRNPTFFFHPIIQRLRNEVINFPIITTAILQILLLAFEFSSTWKVFSLFFTKRCQALRFLSMMQVTRNG